MGPDHDKNLKPIWIDRRVLVKPAEGWSYIHASCEHFQCCWIDKDTRQSLSPCLLELSIGHMETWRLLYWIRAILNFANRNLFETRENTQSDGKMNLSKCIATYSFAKWSNHDVYLVTNFPFPFNSIAGDERMSKTGKGCQAVPSWFSIPLGPPVRAWGSTGRLAGRFCRAAAHTTTGNGTQHQHCTHTTPPPQFGRIARL